MARPDRLQAGLTVSQGEWDAPVREDASTRVVTTYCRAAGSGSSAARQMVQAIGYQSKGDRYDDVYARRSADNGASWSPPVEVATIEHDGDVTIRNRVNYWLDEEVDRLVELRIRNYLRNDEVSAGYRRREYTYAVSRDGGASFDPALQVIEAGEGYDAAHPVRGVWFGKNSYLQRAPYTLAPRQLLLPLQVNPYDPETGELVNPLGCLTFTELQFLHGAWDDDAAAISWRSTEPVRIDPQLSSRGLFEPTVASLAGDGELVCLCRGSNVQLPQRPGRQWLLRSHDGGWTWSEPRPLTWSDGGALEHPSAQSKLIRHSSGALYWIGNAITEPARSNAPRYPLVAARFDERALGPIRDQAVIVDTRRDGESDQLQLSNFDLYEDRETGELIVTLCRLFARGREGRTAGATRYALQLT